jgi:CHASE2 domain-containing sensor protein
LDLRPLARHLSFRNARPFLIALGLGLALWTSYDRVFESYELQTYDWRFKLRGPQAVSKDIVHIDIWDDTLAALGRWPFDREYHTVLIEALSNAGAKAVVFDVEFVEPMEGDDKLAAAARQAGNVYFPLGFSSPVPFRDGYISKAIEAPLLPSLMAAAKGIGFVNAWPDFDGKLRRVMPVIEYQGNSYYQLSFRVLLDVFGASMQEVEYKPRRHLRIKGVTCPLDEDNCFLINYAGLWEDTFKHYSYLDVLSSYSSNLAGEKPVIDLSRFKGKICVVGLTAQGTHDTSPNPFESVYPGVGHYTSLLNTVLRGEFIRRADRATNASILLFLVIATALVTFYRKPLVSFFYTMATMLCFAAAAVNLFIYTRLWVDMFLPLMAMAVTYAAGTLTRIILEMRKRELMESELRIASQIQQSFLPPSPPAQKGLDIAVFMRPAKAVGGDLYTFVPLGEDRLGVMVGDVSGKGTPAALFMGKVVSEFKYSAHDCQDPSQALTRLNDSVAAESTGGLFVTLSYAIFDLKSKTLTLSNAGHLPLVCASAGEGAALLQAEGGMPVGVMPGIVFENRSFPLKDGQCYAFYSDGISEARNKKKEEYGVELMQAVLSRGGAKAAAPLLDEVVAEVTRFIGKAEQHDDMTLILVKVSE